MPEIGQPAFGESLLYGVSPAMRATFLSAWVILLLAILGGICALLAWRRGIWSLRFQSQRLRISPRTIERGSAD